MAPDLAGAARGLSKIISASLDYRLGPVALAVPLLVLLNVLPFAGLFFGHGEARTLSALNVALIALLHAHRGSREGLGTRLLHAALHPFSVGVFVYAVLRSACTTLANDGIGWRGTTYPLEQLKQNVV